MDKETIYREADAILIHTPLTPDTIGMIDDAELKMMKKTTVLINTARGGIISEAALYQALKENWIRGAAIDVFEKEPYDAPEHLAELPPHVPHGLDVTGLSRTDGD